MMEPIELLRRAREVSACCAGNAPNIDVDGAFPEQEFRWLHEAGLLSPEVALSPMPTLLRVLTIIGRGNLSVGRVYEGHVNALQLVEKFAAPVQRARWFNDARNGKLFAVWNTQAQDGVTLQTTRDGVRLNGSKTFCSGAGHVARPIVTGAGENGWQMTVVPMERAQVGVDASFWTASGMRASASYKVDFSGVELHCGDLLGAPDDYYQQPTFSGGAIRFCAVQLGGAQALFEATRDYLRAQSRTDDVWQQARMGAMAAKLESCDALLKRAGELWDANGDATQMVAYAAMCRLTTEDTCNFVLEGSERSVGARGLLRPHPIERIGRDLTLYLKQPHLDEIPVRAGRYILERDASADELWRCNEP